MTQVEGQMLQVRHVKACAAGLWGHQPVLCPTCSFWRLQRAVKADRSFGRTPDLTWSVEDDVMRIIRVRVQIFDLTWTVEGGGINKHNSVSDFISQAIFGRSEDTYKHLRGQESLRAHISSWGADWRLWANEMYWLEERTVGIACLKLTCLHFNLISWSPYKSFYDMAWCNSSVLWWIYVVTHWERSSVRSLDRWARGAIDTLVFIWTTARPLRFTNPFSSRFETPLKR